MFDLLDALRTALGKGVAEIVFGVVSLAILAAGKAMVDLVSKGIDYHRRLARARNAVSRKLSSTGLREGDGVWMLQPIPGETSEQATRHRASRILVVANAKGGVGKTTTVANLGARFARTLPKPVLMIDLDFQGTLSSMSIAQQEPWVPPKGSDSRASSLISGELDTGSIANEMRSAALEPKLKIITAFYDLAQAENRVMVEWLIGDRKEDIRFNLADKLLSPAVREAFSLIIIDCPPRLTTGAVQALACGTHLLIPTVMDEPSSEAVITFVRQVEAFKKAKLCPYIQYIGVVGSLQPNGNIDVTMQRLSDRLSDSIENGGAGGVVKILSEDTFFPTSRFFRNAVTNGGIAYLCMGNSADEAKVKARIEALADHVAREMKL